MNHEELMIHRGLTWAVRGQDGKLGLSVNISMHKPGPDVITCSSTQRKVGSYWAWTSDSPLEARAAYRVEGRPEIGTARHCVYESLIKPTLRSEDE